MLAIYTIFEKIFIIVEASYEFLWVHHIILLLYGV